MYHQRWNQCYEHAVDASHSSEKGILYTVHVLKIDCFIIQLEWKLQKKKNAKAWDSSTGNHWIKIYRFHAQNLAAVRVLWLLILFCRCCFFYVQWCCASRKHQAPPFLGLLLNSMSSSVCLAHLQDQSQSPLFFSELCLLCKWSREHHTPVCPTRKCVTLQTQRNCDSVLCILSPISQ